MARAMHMSGNPNGFQLTHRTTARQMYTFFAQTITEVFEDLEAEISITSNRALDTEFTPHTGLHLFHDTSKPPPALGSFPGPRSFPPPFPNSTKEPKNPRAF